MNYFPDEVLERVFDFVTLHRDRNAVSLVCKLWYRVERFGRERVLVGNCYAISPERVIPRFPGLESLTLKGKPHVVDFNLVPWIEALANSRIGLEELTLKSMLVSDESLELVSHSFANLRSLVLVSCEGFTTRGLEAIAANCRFLRELDLQGNEIYGLSGHWLSCFPESCASLNSLNFECLKGEINLVALESLVARSPNLKSLKLSRAVPVEMLQKILMRAPQLVDLGIGSFTGFPVFPGNETFENLKTAFRNCKSIRNLSVLEVGRRRLPAIYPICFNLTSLNFSCTWFCGPELREMIRYCGKLQRLWIPGYIGDRGLEVIASTCKELQELRVLPPGHSGVLPRWGATEKGLVAISSGCPKLHSLLYFCKQMTNGGLETVAKNCPNIIHFRLGILDPKKPDPVTKQPLDQGFGAIVQSCKRLQRLSLSCLLTDQVCLHIGMYAEQLEMLSIAFAGDSETGMLNVLNGCKKLRKLKIRDSPFGNVALLNVEKYETLRSLWMFSIEFTLGGCKILAKKMA